MKLELVALAVLIGVASCAAPEADERTAAPQPAPETPTLERDAEAELGHDRPVQADEVPVLDGIMATEQLFPVRDSDGKLVTGPDGEVQAEASTVLEATFQGRRKPYKEGDRIAGTPYVVVKIWRDGDIGDGQVRSGVELRRIDDLPPGYMPPAKPEPK